MDSEKVLAAYSVDLGAILFWVDGNDGDALVECITKLCRAYM